MTETILKKNQRSDVAIILLQVRAADRLEQCKY